MRTLKAGIVFYQQIENGNRANQIHGFTIDYSKFILIAISLDLFLTLIVKRKSS